MKYGYFDDAAREYIITNPKTPVKWINYIGTLSFGGFVDQTGGALICKEDPALNRITKYISQMPASDFKGESLYLRLKTPGGFRVFSPFFVPSLLPYDRYECHVGLGYSRIVSQMFGIQTDVTIFVPRGAACEVRRIRVTNLGSEPVEIDVIPVVEYTHFDSLKQLTNADWVPQTMQSEAIEQEGALKVLKQYAFMRRDFAFNYFTSNYPVDSFDTDRRPFLGNNEYGSWASPLSLQQPHLTNSIASRGDNIAALLHAVGRLEPGETREIITILGQASSLEEALPDIERYRQPSNVQQALDEQKEFWEQYLCHQQVRTPDSDLNTMLNVHNPHQCFMTYNWSRYLSLYQLGYGSRGIGFRDSSQDVMGILALAPQEGLSLLRKLLSVQKQNGSAMHQFNPLTMVASEGESLEREDRPHYYSDDHLWIVLAVTAYLKETGDFNFLDEAIPYYEKDKANQPLESGSVYDHLIRAVEYTHADTGQHGLPLLGFADWNDTVNLAKGAESMFTASLYGAALRELSDLAAFRQDAALKDRLDRYYTEMKARVNEQAWDGDWFISYFDADGTALGSKHNAYGQIYTHVQPWTVISGLASEQQAQALLNAIEERLNTANGIKLSMPGFNGFDPEKGGITTYPPGAKENGGIFLHVNPWVIIAETLAGNSERAYRYYRQINPASKNDQIDSFECEPYVYPQNILGDEHPMFGLARNSWLSGTASWMYQAATRYLLGIQPTYTGLRISPCIPAEWDGYEVTRLYRGAEYHITIQNPQHVSRGVRQVIVNGDPIIGDVLPILNEGQHQVQVILG
jgi:cellobiose phosphorylase